MDMDMYGERKPFLCDECHCAFTEPEELEKHIATEHNEEDDETTGTIGELSFAQSSGFQKVNVKFAGVRDVKLEQTPMVVITVKPELNEAGAFETNGGKRNGNAHTHHDENCELMVKGHDDAVEMGSCFINMFAANHKKEVQQLRNFLDFDDSDNEEDIDGEESWVLDAGGATQVKKEPEDVVPPAGGDDSDDDIIDDLNDGVLEPSSAKVKIEIDIAEAETNDFESFEVANSLIEAKSEDVNKATPTVLKPAKSHECKVCRLIFNRKAELVKHSKSHREKINELQCKKCDKILPSKRKLKKHKQEHTEGKPYKCTTCGRHFSTDANFQRHLLTHVGPDGEVKDTGKKTYLCSVCAKEFGTGNHLKQHMMIHTGYRPHHCSQCGKGFIKRADLFRHQTTHSEVKPFLCSLCAKGFGTSVQLKYHMMMHSGEKPFTCPTCGKGFICEKYLKIHEKRHSGKKPFLCNLCGRGLSSKKRFEAHVMLHRGEKAFPCTLCDKSYTNKHQLAKHLELHAQGPFLCKLCNKQCKGKLSLERHTKTCNGDTRHLLEKFREIECPVCKKLVKKHNMRQHAIIHSGEKPYACSQCNKAYKRKYLLEEHMRTHSGERPFVCSICHKAFARKLNMQVHMRTHGENAPPRQKKRQQSTAQAIQQSQAPTHGMNPEVKTPDLPYDYTLSAPAQSPSSGESTV